MIFSSPTDISQILILAKTEIKNSVRAIRNELNPYSDPNVTELCTELRDQFASISKRGYDTDDSASADTQRDIYSYPIRYLDTVFHASQGNCMKILPYLLAAYYINYPLNRILPPLKQAKLLSEGSLSAEDVLFEYDDSPTNALPPRYNQILESFCNHFSLEGQVDRFLKNKRTQYPKEIQQLTNRSALIAFLNSGPKMQKKHCPTPTIYLEKAFQAYLYSICISCCASVPALSAKIDYALSADLFNEHTLAFESRYNTKVDFRLKDWFSPTAFFDTLTYFLAVEPENAKKPNVKEKLTLRKLKSNLYENHSALHSVSGTIEGPVKLPPNATFEICDLCLPDHFSESDLARNVSLLYMVIFDSDNWARFYDQSFLNFCLTHQSPAPLNLEDDD